MNNTVFLLLALIVFSFLGGVSILLPNIPSSNWTWLFRKENKEKYVVYSNRFMGKVFLIAAGVSLLLLVASFIFKLAISPLIILGCFVAYYIISVIFMEIMWRRQLQRNDE